MVTSTGTCISRGYDMIVDRPSSTHPGEMYLVAEKKLRCIAIEEHVAIASDGIDGPEAAMKLLAPFFKDQPYEEVYAVAVDSSNRFLGFLKLEEGTVNSATVHLRKILTFLLCEVNATGLILAHNHPGGSCMPSAEDIALTRRLSQRLADIQVRLLDHLIYVPGRFGSESQWLSMSNEGHISA